MCVGNKKIYHLEAWVVKVMSLYKVSTSGVQLSVLGLNASVAFSVRHRYVGL